MPPSYSSLTPTRFSTCQRCRSCFEKQRGGDAVFFFNLKSKEFEFQMRFSLDVAFPKKIRGSKSEALLGAESCREAGEGGSGHFVQSLKEFVC